MILNILFGIVDFLLNHKEHPGHYSLCEMLNIFLIFVLLFLDTKYNSFEMDVIIIITHSNI